MSSQVRERISIGVPRRIRRKPLGLNAAEIVAILVTAAFAVAALYYYLTTLGPEQRRLQGFETKLNELETELIKARAERDQPPAGDTSRDALDSLADFKQKHLKTVSQGEIALYRDLNALAAKHQAQITSSIEMKRENQAKLDKNEAKKKEAKSKADPLSTVYPQTAINFSVAGQYANLRAFLNELERNNQFIIIRSVALTKTEQVEEGGGRRRRSADSGAITLAIEMSAYFHP
ncbi:MAG: hypothetical protein AB1631_23875, partial [Acidobacteriota bacterium]